MSETATFDTMRERVVAAIMANPVVVPDSLDLMARIKNSASDCTFEELAFDSLARMEFCIFLECEFGISITSGSLESHPSIAAMARYLAAST
jgi:acyl carrier protein